MRSKAFLNTPSVTLPSCVPEDPESPVWMRILHFSNKIGDLLRVVWPCLDELAVKIKTGA